MRQVFAGFAALSILFAGPAEAQTASDPGTVGSRQSETRRERQLRESREDVLLDRSSRSRDERRLIELRRLQNNGRNSGSSWSRPTESAPANAPRRSNGAQRQNGTVQTQ